MRRKWYVGLYGCGRMAFGTKAPVSEATHGNSYHAVIGPFKTMRAARFMARYGGSGNPHLQTVADAEMWAKKAEQERA